MATPLCDSCKNMYCECKDCRGLDKPADCPFDSIHKCNITPALLTHSKWNCPGYIRKETN